AAGHTECVRLVQVAWQALVRFARGNPEVVPLHEIAGLADVRDVDGEFAAVENVAEASVHAALGRLADADLAADFLEGAVVAVGVELGDAVIVGEYEIGVTGAAEVGGDDAESPPLAGDAGRFRDVFERAVALVVEQIAAAAVLRVLE